MISRWELGDKIQIPHFEGGRSQLCTVVGFAPNQVRVENPNWPGWSAWWPADQIIDETNSMATEFSLLEVKQIIENEGLGYAVQDYLTSDRILDPTLKQLWDTAQHSLNAIERYLETGKT